MTQPVAAPETAHYRRMAGTTGIVAEQPAQGVDPLQMFKMLWRGKSTILLCALIAFVIGTYYSFEIAVSKYSSSARLAMEVRNQQVVDIDSVLSGGSTDQASINTELGIIHSRGLIDKLIDDLDLTKDPEFNTYKQKPPLLSAAGVRDRLTPLFPSLELPPPTEEEIRIVTNRAVMDAISVSAERDAYLLNIRVTLKDREKTALMANRLADLYLKDQVDAKFNATEYAVDWLSERVTELEFELKQKEDAINDLVASSNLVSSEALEALNIRAKEMRDRLQETQDAMAAAQRALTDAEAIASGDDLQMTATSLQDPLLTRLLPNARQGDAQAVTAFDARVATLVEQKRQRVQRTSTQRDALVAANAKLQEEIKEQSQDNIKLTQLRREAEATRVLYETFLTRFKETSVQIGLQQPDSRILSPAILGDRIKPRRSLNMVLSFLLGATLGAIIVLSRQMFYDGFRTADELASRTGKNVLGQIPIMPIRKRAGLADFLRNNPTSAAVEAIRNLRTSVVMSNLQHPPQVIMMTSSLPGEGKTTQAIALAHNFAGLHKRILLIEGDIRRRTYSNYFTPPKNGGLLEAILGDYPVEELIIPSEELGCDMLLAGSESQINAADLFASAQFGALIARLRKMYDFIVIDTPPVLVVPDSRVIGQHVDSVIYSVKWNSTSPEQVNGGLRQLEEVGLPVAGLTLSQIDAKSMRSYGYGDRYGAYAQYGNSYYNK